MLCYKNVLFTIIDLGYRRVCMLVIVCLSVCEGSMILCF